MSDENECQREIFVNIRWEGEALAVPLSQLSPVSVVDENTIQAVEDWHYWSEMGYEF